MYVVTYIRMWTRNAVVIIKSNISYMYIQYYIATYSIRTYVSSEINRKGQANQTLASMYKSNLRTFKCD